MLEFKELMTVFQVMTGCDSDIDLDIDCVGIVNVVVAEVLLIFSCFIGAGRCKWCIYCVYVVHFVYLLCLFCAYSVYCSYSVSLSLSCFTGTGR